MISKETINRVFDTALVEEVIGEFVQLKKAGSNFKGLSPFSDERTPSFIVSPVKQIWKDFSTGKGGNVVSFLMEHEHYTYPEAIKYLAKKYNIEIEETEQTDLQKQQANERESMFVVSEFARDYFANVLHTDSQGKAIGLSYFKERGYTNDIIKKFQLGYCLNNWDSFTNEALNKGFNIKYLESTGLTIVKQDAVTNETKQFDRFKGRVMFPIHSMSGRVLGFGGRILTSDKKAAKYLNSPDSEIYHKSNILYGIHFSKQAIAREDNCYLVEGYTDVLSFHQAEIENVVASSGTALTENQIRLINRLTKNITILFDGDAAGIRASLRGIDLILEQGMNVRVVSFPEGDDPDSFSKKVSPFELKEYLNSNSQDFINFKVSLLLEEAENDPVKKAGLIRDIVVSISKIPDRIQQEVYLQECSRIMDISESVLFNELAQLSKKEAREASGQSAYVVAKKPGLQKTPELKRINQLTKYEREIVKILLLYGNQEAEFIDFVSADSESGGGSKKLKKVFINNLVSKEVFLNLQDDEIEFTDELFREVYTNIMLQLNQNNAISIEDFINSSNPEIANLVTNILMDDEKYTLSDWGRKEIYVKTKDKNIAKLVMDAIYNLRRVLITEKINSLTFENYESEQQRNQNLEFVVQYTLLRTMLSEKLQRVV